MNKIIKFPKNVKTDDQLITRQLLDGERANFTKFCFYVAIFTSITLFLLLFGLGML